MVGGGAGWPGGIWVAGDGVLSVGKGVEEQVGYLQPVNPGPGGGGGGGR